MTKQLEATEIDAALVRDPRPDVLAAWDLLVSATPGTDVTQLSGWARVRAMEHFRCEYLFVRRGRSLVGGAQILLRRVPGLGRIGYVSYGPVIAQGLEERAAVVSDVAHGLAGLRGVRMLFIQPPEGGEDVREALLASGFRPSTAGIAPTGSVRLDLQRSEEEIRRGFAPRLRSRIRRWPTEGVQVRVGNEADIPLLAGLMRAAADARGYQRPPSEDYLRHMYVELARTGNAALFVGEVHGEPVTADMITICGGMVRGRWSGFDRCGEGRRLSVPGAARWEIIRWAQREGYRWLDFGGLSEQALRDAVDRGISSSMSWPGPDQAKMQYGGTPFRYPGAVELLRPRLVRQAYDAVSGSARGRAALHRVKVELRSRPSRPHRSLIKGIPSPRKERDR